ncbi:MAG: ornithine cyclodeaminase [Muribaculaceae bacterium]|nr:ornithine cyclodeaminase [Muribaculaceae bacterium]MDE6295412.1 ornithine cyclodeaminase [Muribaculaceae bacterium]
MQIITSRDIERLNISPAESVEWVRQAFLMKDRCQLPPKISLHPRGNDFINTMPCLLPEEYHTFGCKVVSRIKGNHPALKSEMMVFDTLSGDLTALVNCDWITARRTGAVATLAINTFRNTHARIYSFIGLGAMAYATLDCFFATNKEKQLIVRLKRYKDQAEKVIERYKDIPNVIFEISDTIEQLVKDADVIVSCITDADGLLVDDTDLFKPGVLIVPVHTRGFQNCDTIFDKIFADDEGHVKGFRYFSQFRYFDELANILSGKSIGRTNDSERILSYNIGLGLHDIYYAWNIIERMQQNSL